jgi:hypothetical protein
MIASAATLCVLMAMSTGCQVMPSSGTDVTRPIVVPASARLIGYGLYIPMTAAPPGSGTVYFVEDETHAVVYVMTAPPDYNGAAMLASDLPHDVSAAFDPSKHYRVYWTPAASPPASQPTPATQQS